MRVCSSSFFSPSLVDSKMRHLCGRNYEHVNEYGAVCCFKGSPGKAEVCRGDRVVLAICTLGQTAYALIDKLSTTPVSSKFSAKT